MAVGCHVQIVGENRPARETVVVILVVSSNQGQAGNLGGQGDRQEAQNEGGEDAPAVHLPEELADKR